MGIAYNPRTVTDGLVLCLDAANKKCYSHNYHPRPTDLYGWVTSGHQQTLSRDTIQSPVGSTPLKIVTLGTSSYTNSYNSSIWNIASASQGQTWTVSFYVKASVATTISMLIFEANSNGNYTTYTQPYFNIGTEWTRVSGTATFTQATTAFIQARIDCYVDGVTLWVDGMQVERSSSVSTFTSVYTGDVCNNIISSSNNGTLTNGVSYSDSNGGSFVFDGINDYVDCGNPTSLSSIGGTNNITVSGWVYYTSYGGGGQSYSVITVKGNPWTWLLENPSNTFRFRITAGGSDVSVADTSTHLLNTWYNVVGTYDGSNMRIYVNGVLKNTLAQSGTLATNAVTAKIGTFQGTNYNLTGRISNISVYNRTLAASEIQQNYNALKARYAIDIVRGGLVLHLDAGSASGYSGTTWKDLSGVIGDVNVQNRSTDWSFQTDSSTGQVCLYNDSTRTSNPGIDIPVNNGFNKLEGTIDLWLKPTSHTGGNGWFNNSDGNAHTNAGNWFWIGTWDTSNLLYFRQGNPSTCCNDLTISSFTGVYPLNTWQHWCITWKVSSGQAAIYKNGILQASTSGLPTNIPNTNPTNIGQLFNGHSRGDNMQFRGYCNTYKIYNRSLTAAEVQQNFNALRGRFSI